MPSPIAMLAAPTRVEALCDWVRRNRGTLQGFELLITADVAEGLRAQPITQEMKCCPVSPLRAGGDLEIAARILRGEVVGLIAFLDPDALRTGAPDLDGLLRACLIRQIPFALNESSASLALRGLSESRVAYLIFNPVAGQGTPQQELALIRNVLEPQVLVHVVMTQPDLDPAEQARDLVTAIQALEPEEAARRMIIASGGDGTVSAVAGAMEGSDIPLGILPRGTANAFSVALGIPTDLRTACTTILVGNTRVVDTARCNEVPMILLAGMGFEAGMVEGATRELKNRIGPLAYLLAGARQIGAQQPFEATLEFDGQQRSITTSAITVANVAPPTSVMAQGYGAVIPDDGLLEVTIASPADLLEGLQALGSLVGSALSRTASNLESVLTFRVSQLRIHTDPVQKLVVDGEILEAESVEFRCLPGSLRVIAPLETT
jgi:YegS/Rv2252/BmrU family lipid kinase